MQDKTKITYWLSPAGECNPVVEVMSTMTSKVPERGEVINFNTKIDRENLAHRFSEYGSDWDAFLPSGEKEIKGDFVVVDVKRWLKYRIKSQVVSEWIDAEGNKCSSTSFRPMTYSNECFEVIIEPFRETELTETPIAKVRNLLGSVFGVIDMLNLIKEHPDKEKELLELFKDTIETTKESLVKLREIIGNDKNWK